MHAVHLLYPVGAAAANDCDPPPPLLSLYLSVVRRGKRMNAWLKCGIRMTTFTDDSLSVPLVVACDVRDVLISV